MKMDGDVMKMRAVQGGLDLPAGKTVELKPGGYHVMLMDLKAALPKDTTVPMTLVFKDAKGMESKVEIKVPVATAAPGAPAGGSAVVPTTDRPQVFNQLCVACHALGGQGGAVGPALDRVGDRFVEALVAAARRGVRVRVLLDGWGSAPHAGELARRP